MRIHKLLAFIGLALWAASCAGGGSEGPQLRESRVESADARPSVPAATDGAAATAPVMPAAPAAGLPRIVFLGDSLTAGLGLQPHEAVPALIQARLNQEGYRYEVVNAGVSGDTSAGGLRRLNWSLAGSVKLLVIELGANDGLRGLPVSQLKANLAEIITTARRRDIDVLLTGMEAPPNYGAAYTTEFREVYRELAREQHVPLVAFFLDGVAGNPALNQQDGIHPNAEGARIIERAIWAAIEPLLEERDS